MKDKKTNVVIYPITGRQGLFYIPKKWCEECDLVIALVRDTVKELNMRDEVVIKIRPWFLWAWLAFLRYLAWHPPILAINGRLVSQGIVPPKKAIMENLKRGRSASF